MNDIPVCIFLLIHAAWGSILISEKEITISYFEEIADKNDVRPGDILTTGGHCEIVVTKIENNQFDAIGGHSDGASKETKTYGSYMKFFRVQ